eukprot:TRINITY_DN1139_c1_g1_i2.p4 TRINITY_DN1139_c1_g1~~TRINITY_DN1139_c1_g1_i2.p4  ORF type:complete len:161 (-),score=53.61 TRINITY_DN1139_c1_g1_i2:141-623(-)
MDGGGRALGAGTAAVGGAEVVAHSEVRERGGTYWGYTTRHAPSFASLFLDCPYEAGYDCLIGVAPPSPSSAYMGDVRLQPFKHMIVVLRGERSLDECVAADDALEGIDTAAALFHHYAAALPPSSSSSSSSSSLPIPCEDELLMVMSSLMPRIRAANGRR